MASNAEKKIWLEFFEIYRQLPEVWQIQTENYKNKAAKKQAYEVLLEKYKEIDSDGTVEVLKRKINNFRTCYRRELKKVNNSIRSGSGADDVYVPNLWYYEALDFLKGQEPLLEDVSSADLKAENENCVSNDSSRSSPQLCSTPTSNRKRTKLDRNQVTLIALENLGRSEKKDEADILAAGWATCYRKLDSKQQLFANKIINEVLFQAALGKLTEHSHKAIDSSIQTESRPSTTALRNTPDIAIPSPTPLSQHPSEHAVYLRPEPAYPITIVRADKKKLTSKVKSKAKRRNAQFGKRNVQEQHDSQNSDTSLEDVFTDPNLQ